jgi:hypothetical protein
MKFPRFRWRTILVSLTLLVALLTVVTGNLDLFELLVLIVAIDLVAGIVWVIVTLRKRWQRK